MEVQNPPINQLISKGIEAVAFGVDTAFEGDVGPSVSDTALLVKIIVMAVKLADVELG